MKRIAHAAAPLVALIASMLVSAQAKATPGAGFAPSPIVTGHFGTLNVNTAGDKTEKWGLVLKTLDDTDVGTVKLTVQPGGYSGWHLHPAPIYVTVTQGSIIWHDGSNPLCTPHTYGAGESFVENAYVIHNVENASNSSTAEFYATRVAPTGVAVTIDKPEPNNCSF